MPVNIIVVFVIIVTKMVVFDTGYQCSRWREVMHERRAWTS